MKRCGTGTGGTHLPHRQRPENDRAFLIHFILIWQNRDFFFFFFPKTVLIPHLLLEDFFCFSQFRSSSTALLCQMVARSPRPSGGAGDRAQAR